MGGWPQRNIYLYIHIYVHMYIFNYIYIYTYILGLHRDYVGALGEMEKKLKILYYREREGETNSYS